MCIIFRLVSIAVTIYSWAILAYLILSLLLPNHQITQFLKGISEPVLSPVRVKLYQWFPALKNIAFDVTPIAVFFLLGILERIVSLLA